MKLWSLNPKQFAGRRSRSGGGGNPLDGETAAAAMAAEVSFLKSPAAAFWLAIHGLCCLVSLILGFRFSKLVFFLLFTTTANYSSTPATTAVLRSASSLFFPPPPPPAENQTAAASRVVVGRHGILIRPWPHPNPSEVMAAHGIIDRVQKEQRFQYGVRNPRPVIAITPTYVRTFQALHLTGIIHTLMLVPYELTWIVVEAGGVTNETAAMLAGSKIRTIHVPFEEKMPIEWAERHMMESRMRFEALRVVREQRLDGIVVFLDESNVHTMRMFDEIQKVNWFGGLSVGILANSANSESMPQDLENDAGNTNLIVPIQGPSCNSSGKLVGWHTFNTLPFSGNSAVYVGDGATVLPMKLEWSGFVLNSRLVWREVEGRPDWVQDLDTVTDNGVGIESPVVLLKDAKFAEPLGDCGKKVMVWWLRVEARPDSKFPPGWKIDPPLDIVVPAKRTPWPDVAPPEQLSETASVLPGHAERSPKSRTSRPRRGSHSKRKHELHREMKTASLSHV